MTAAGGPLVSVRGVSKEFGGARALVDVSLDVRPGEVHALVGQNGSGKSTLVKVLSGYHAPDTGVVLMRGVRVRCPISARELRENGIEFVQQELGLVDTMSVLENLRIGRFVTGVGWRIRWRRERVYTENLLRRFELDIDPDMPVSALSQSQRAIVAIMRALQDVESDGRTGVLVLDEPTARLPKDQISSLFAAIRRVTAGGSAVLLVTHDMDEVFAVADRVSVLRDGHLVVTQPTLGLDTSALIELILGRKLGDLYPSLSTEIAGAVLEVDGLTGSIAHDITLSVRRGEILGLTGVTGDAHEEVPYLLYGAQSSRHGTVRLHGSPINPLTPVHCKRAGIGFLPANRQREGGIGRATVGENVTLPDLKSFRVPWGLNHAAERAAIRQALEDFDVRPADPGRLFGNLSGGNQQKVLLARWIRMNPEVLVLHEPTQGVDVGARAGIFRFLREAASRGMSIVYASTEYEDLAHVCNRVLVLRRGRVTAEFGGATLTSEAILRELYRREGEPSRTVRAENPSDQVTPRGGTHE